MAWQVEALHGGATRGKQTGGDGNAAFGIMATTTKRDIVRRLSRSSGIPAYRLAYLLDDLLAIIVEDVRKGNRIEIRGFGTFDERERRGLKGYRDRPRKCGESFRDIRFSCSQSLRIWGE